MPSPNKLYNKIFSHIYIEKAALQHPSTEQILKKIKYSKIIEIDNYKEVFNRNKQNFQTQKISQKLILAKRSDEFLYKGSSIAPNFLHDHFYYNAIALNCLYNCEYCYLQGMFPSAHMVVFVNNEDYIRTTKEKLDELGSMYLCLSYDTDLLALEDIFGYCSQWIEFARNNPSIVIEIRTKSAQVANLLKVSPIDNVVLAWTITPDLLAKTYEHKAPTLKARIAAIKKITAHGWKVRLCLDPILSFDNWKEYYDELIAQLRTEIKATEITELSLGSFRMGKTYFKNFQKALPHSKLSHQNLQIIDNSYHLKDENEVLSYVKTGVSKWLAKEKIFTHSASK